MDLSTIPARLEQIANLSEFAAQCGISRRQLQRIKQGISSPSLTTCTQIADAIVRYRPRKK